MLQLNKLNELVQNRCENAFEIFFQLFYFRHQISWYPNMWAQNLLRKARKEGLIQNDWFAHVLIKEVLYKSVFLASFIFPNIADILLQVDNMANMNGMLILYGWVNIPLVYTQVIRLVVVKVIDRN